MWAGHLERFDPAVTIGLIVGGLAIGLTLTLIHLISIPVTNTSVNPARSTSQAIFAGSDQLGRLWLFWVAPVIGAAVGAAVHRYVIGNPPARA